MLTRTLILASVALITLAAPASGGDWAIPAATQKDYAANVAVAVTAGLLTPDSSTGSGMVGGLELSFNDPLIQLPYGRLRDSVGYSHVKHGGLQLDSFEFNVHYQVPLAGDTLWAGFGPGFGWVITDSDAGPSPNLWAGQIGADITYMSGNVLIGFDSRWQWTESDRVGNAAGADNWKNVIKIGWTY